MNMFTSEESDINFPQRATILIVDDAPDNLSLLSSLLKDVYNVKVANNGEKALKIARDVDKPDLILLDIIMKGLSGYDVLRELKANPATRHIPVIFLTAMAGEQDEGYGLKLGAADYITKPISAPIVLSRIKTHLDNKSLADFMRNSSADGLENKATKSNKESSGTQDVIILALATLAEMKYPGVSSHIQHVPRYIKILADALEFHPRFTRFLSKSTIDQLCKIAPFYDIGKVGIPHDILLKAATLTAQEFDIMKTHTSLGKKAIEHAERVLTIDTNFKRIAKEVVYYHHEKWDGSGYPIGIAGDAIPISARIMSVVDVYNALVNKGAYKDVVTHEHAVRIITAGRGTNFDPDVVDAFITLKDEFLAIKMRFPIRRFI